MRPRLDSHSILGALALGVSLLLASPGVQVAAAEDGRNAPLSLDGSEKTSCDVDDVPGTTSRRAVTSRAALARIQALMQQELAQGGEKPIVLNPRGYNYQADRDPATELRIIQRELARQ